VKRLVLCALIACGSKHDENVCKLAFTKYTTCVKEILGSDAEKLADSKEDIAGCAHDAKSVAMYTKCLGETDCTKFMNCLETFARDSTPSISTTLPRKAQCEKHVADGLRGIASQVVVLNEVKVRDDAAKNAAQRCILDEMKPWADCITPAERTEVGRYGTERQTECEAWPPELAACIFHQPNATKCDPDSEPLWRLPREQGPPGPRVEWSLDVVSTDDLFLAWTADHALVVHDDDGVRLVRGGKVAWTVSDPTKHDVLVGNVLVGRREGGALGLLDLASRSLQAVTVGSGVEVFGAAGDKVVVRTNTNDLYELAPATCKKPSCAKKVGSLGDDAIMTETIGVWHDLIWAASSTRLQLTDRHGTTKLDIAMSDDNNDMVVAGDELMIDDNKGVAILSLPGCMAKQPSWAIGSTLEPAPGCIVAQQAVSWVATITPTALAGGAVAYNDHGIVERTQSFGAGAPSWAVETGGNGPVIGDDNFVYVVTLGLDDKGPVRLLALARATGHVAWQTDLLATPPESPKITMALRDHQLVVGVGAKLYGLALK
jgi:hypothetical protein